MMGKVIMSGIVPPLVAPSVKILASDIAVGSSVYLMENGDATEYLVVNHGKPSGSSMYDDSCDGTWLLRKESCGNMAWNTTQLNDYANSTIHSYLNSTFFNLLGTIEQETVKQVKIPYRAGSGTSNVVSEGVNGLSTKVFLLSMSEINSKEYDYHPKDGMILEYSSLNFHKFNKDRAWTRTPYTSDSRAAVLSGSTGGAYFANVTQQTVGDVFPTVVIPSTALFDANTLILKGVA